MSSYAIPCTVTARLPRFGQERCDQFFNVLLSFVLSASMNRSVENGCILVRKSFTNMLPGLTAVLGAMTWKFEIGGVALKVIHTGDVAVARC